MTWFFDRGVESLSLEVRRVQSGYDVLVHHADGRCSVKHASTAAALLERVQSVPSSLITDGWHPRSVDTLWRSQPVAAA